MSEYRDPLPADCPPAEATVVEEYLGVFRAIAGPTPCVADFLSQRALQPNSPFKGVSECQCRGLSVFTVLADANRLRTLPKFKTGVVCKVALEAGAGAIQQTQKPSHHTWWPRADFDILAHCEVVAT